MAYKRKIKRSTQTYSITLDEAFDEFISEKMARNLSKATIKNYQTTYGIFKDFYGYDSETLAEEMKVALIYKWVNIMKMDGRSVASINHYIRDIRCFFYWCMDETREYMPYFKIQSIVGQEEPLKLFTNEDIAKLLDKPKKSEGFVVWRTWAIVNWVLGTGNRAATICSVRLSDINYAKREIVLHHTKNKKAQVIPLSSSLESCLKEYIRMWRREAATEGFLFPSIGDEQLSTNALQSSFKRYCEDRDVSRHNIHGLRHNFAKGWVQNNGNVFVLQKVLGHQTLEMTRKYVKLFNEDYKEDYDKYAPLDTIKKAASRTQKIKRA